MFRKFLFLSILWMSLLFTSGHAAVTSLDYTFVANDQYSDDFWSRLNSNNQKLLNGGINSISTANIVDDTLTESDFSDEINPRVRTYEGAACEFVYTGLLPVTAASLTTNTAAGTAYPRGYRINKSSSTAHSYTASKWTFVDIDQNGDFQYSEVSIGAATPSVATNSIRLARVSTDAATVLAVQDMRTTSCTVGNFSGIVANAGANVSLDDTLKSGQPVRRFSPAGRTPQGWVQGLFVSYDTATTFKVTGGSAYINGVYRFATTDTSVPTSVDNPTSGVSGIDSGTVTGGPLRYYIYAVADQESVETYSITYSTSGTAPSGLTNYRLIGSINTDATNLFTSRDVVTAHAISEREIIGAWVNFDTAIFDSYNVSSITDAGSGTYTVTFDSDFNNAKYAASGFCSGATWNSILGLNNAVAPTAGAIGVQGQRTDNGVNNDCTLVMLSAVGDSKK